jgi:hypothetical protein
LECVVSSR